MIENLEDLIVYVRDNRVLLDADVAAIYGVDTKRVNEAVKNNPDKFPTSYVLTLNDVEFADLRSKFSTAKSAMTRVAPKAFTEKGLYMLATVLKSPQATQATISIVETFAKLRELSRNVQRMTSYLRKLWLQGAVKCLTDTAKSAFEGEPNTPCGSTTETCE